MFIINNLIMPTTTTTKKQSKSIHRLTCIMSFKTPDIYLYNTSTLALCNSPPKRNPLFNVSVSIPVHI